MNTDKDQVPQCDKTAVKCRFFAQYYGTKTMYVGGVGLVEIGTGGWNLKHPDFFLQLKPLSKITDEDIINVWDLIYDKTRSNEVKLIQWKEQDFLYALVDVKQTIKAVDYLRSKGYALPFMEYSVEDLISFGWVQLV